ncbi:MAG: uL22 family ribosomal protein [Candidatus Micrarchaeia archaeon]
MMHKYSFPVTGNMAVAQAYDVNASYKDLCAVCDAIRYAKADDAFAVLDSIISKKMPIHVRRFNKHMGAKHELGGAKGAFPVMAAKEVRKVLINALANADSKGIDTSNAIIAYATANKTHIERRSPSKGSLSWGRGMYGYSARVHSDIEYAKIELALAEPEEVGRKPRKVRLPYVRQEKKQQAANKPKAAKALSSTSNTETKQQQKPEAASGEKKQAEESQKQSGNSSENKAKTAKPADNDDNAKKQEAKQER